INVIGPLPADTLFNKDNLKEYDARLCMFHDQALIPIKTLDFFNGVNFTSGLSFIRTSPDHGTAFNISGKNIANPNSLISSIKQAKIIAKNRQSYG
ncbi:4-hydroxythreonine-4-phosphate dehydrogenase PdxA, partial [Rhodobiaceae bacterium]|nr:4-hydroxythreonine-4-phosphate dehydrogenase PdxA [Rhodobiaceae bacterium]